MAEYCRAGELGLFRFDASRSNPRNRALTSPRMGHSSASSVHPRAAKREHSIRQERELNPEEEARNEYWRSFNRLRRLDEADPILREYQSDPCGGAHRLGLSRLWRCRRADAALHKASQDTRGLDQAKRATARPVAGSRAGPL